MSADSFRRRARRQTARRRGYVRPVLEALEPRVTPAGVNVLTFHNDLASTGQNLAEIQLTPANVKVGSFGKLYATTLDGQVYAQPLVDTGVTIANGPHTTTGAAGVHDTVFVATEHDDLYALDTTSGAILWQRSFLNVADATDNTLGATAITTLSSNDVGTTDISPEIGITGTPVIDPNTNLLYVVAKTKETIGGNTYFVQRLHAVNLADGTDQVAPYLIGDTDANEVDNTPIYVYGNGDGSVTDPYNGTGNLVDPFDALRENQRGALMLVNNLLYVDWASHGDNGPYHGWVVAWDVSKLTTSGWKLTGVLNTTPNGGLGGIWQSSGRLAFEADGSAFYFETGNGTFDTTQDANGFPVHGDYGDSLVKVTLDPTTSATNQNVNGWGLKVVDYFTPFNQGALDSTDEDFGSGAPLLLPDSAGLPGHPHLLLAGGKEGKLYLVDRDNLGKYDPNNDHVLNAVPNGNGQNTPPVLLAGLNSTAAYYNGKIYAVSAYSGTADAFAINADGTLATTSVTAVGNFGYIPGAPSISANGATDGIVWLMDRNANELHAYDAGTLATELWNSGQKAGGADNLGAPVKFAVPTVANGEVFVGTLTGLVAYGLTPPANAVPAAPTNLVATALSSSSVSLTWQDPTAPPNTASGYTIDESTDNITFTPVTTAPAGATSIAVGGLQALATYYFQVVGFNGLGNSPAPNVAQAKTTNQAAGLDFSAGFTGSTAALTYNGSAALNGSKAELTNSGANQAGSVFSSTLVDVSRFTSQFTFQLSAGASTADGFTFTIQNNGPTALGPFGGALGYGDGSPASILSSVAVKFDLFDNNGEGPDSTGLYTDGAAPMSAGSIDLTSSGVDLHSGDVFQVSLGYDGTTLTVTITDTQTAATATQTYPIDIPGTLGSSAAYVGFTGGTGGITSTQDILTWTFAPNAIQAPAAPSTLGGQAASGTAISLSWTNNATNQTGFHLDRATDSGFTQNLITETLPAAPSTFTDTAAGLAPGGTYYYRLRATNTAGDSANSNVAAVTIPLAPATPTGATVVQVSSSEIDLTWTDHAGRISTGYQILRQANGTGGFTQVANLPVPTLNPPSQYPTWADTHLTPGTFYEYHVIAYNVSGHNDFTGTNATTITLAPSGLTAQDVNAAVKLAWTAPSAFGALTYNIYRGTTQGGEGSIPLVTGLSTASYTDATVVQGQAYYYEVTAVNANATRQPPLAAESAVSNEASVTIALTTGSLTAQIAAIVPDPRNTAVSSIAITFNHPVAVFNLASLSLTTEGGPNLLTSAQTLTSSDDLTWTLGNLAGLTNPSGRVAAFHLTLKPAGITDPAGDVLGAVAPTSFTEVDPALTLVNTTLTVPGTSGNDTFTFTPGTTDLATLNGAAYAIDPTVVSTVQFTGNGGADTAVLNAAGTGNTATLGLGNGSLRGSGYAVGVSGVTSLVVRSTTTDTAMFADSSGNNTFVGTPGYSYLSDGTHFSEASGFRDVVAMSTSPGQDTAALIDSSGSNTFVATPAYSYLSNGGSAPTFIEVVGFKSVQATAAANTTDAAYFYDAKGANRFLGTSTYSYLVSDGALEEAIGFGESVAIAPAGGQDTANLYGAAGNGVFIGTPGYSYYVTTGATNVAVGFLSVAASATGGSDSATLYDAAGKINTFVATPAYAYLMGTGYFNEVIGFIGVTARASAGSTDAAYLFGSTAGGDTFVGTPGISSLRGSGFFNQVVGFGSVSAFGDGPNDVAYLYDSANGDTFVGMGGAADLYGPGYGIAVDTFTQVIAYGTVGATNKLALGAIDYLFSAVGSWTPA